MPTPEPDGGAGPERIQKVLARCGYGSRRVCEELIADGRVTVDGTVAELGDRVDPDRQRLAVDGALVAARADLVHYLCNKPVGVVSTARDTHGRPTVVDLVPAGPRVYPVGRLDADSEGLIIVTNDGDLAQVLMHPRHGVEKEYLVEVDGHPSPAALRRLREGVELDDGPTAPARVTLVQGHDDRSAVTITIHEGRNRQVRRMLDAVGHPVRRLVRTRIGPLRDPDLAPGAWRSLTPAEVRRLAEAATDPEARGRPR